LAGKIKDEDIALVRERTSIEDVISEHVTLRSAGGGNLKGLCPFHDEKTASFNVSPTRNVYFCHGCGAGGDAIKFLMDHDHLSFVESVERLASKAGLQLRYVEAGSAPVRPSGQKHRLIAAHAEAARFYAEQLGSPGARKAREFLAQRGFSKEAAERYGCGFAPEGWDNLAKYLRQKGFSAAELIFSQAALSTRPKMRTSAYRKNSRLVVKPRGMAILKIFTSSGGPAVATWRRML